MKNWNQNEKLESEEWPLITGSWAGCAQGKGTVQGPGAKALPVRIGECGVRNIEAKRLKMRFLFGRDD